MTRILFDRKKHVWDPETNTFSMSERDVKFDTSYILTNPGTLGSMIFEFKESTGPEFHPSTKWIYSNEDKTIKLEVVNDPRITKIRAEAYLKHKLGI